MGAVGRLIRMAFVILLSSTAGMALASELRERINFNREWAFQPDDVSGADRGDFDDAHWGLKEGVG